MPLVTIPGEQAVAIRKANPVAFWGNRAEVNRVEPLAKPEFYPSFTLERTEPIFTIGSCFARHVERELLSRGFRIPMLEIMKDPLFANLKSDILNNYGTPSIYNELAWALDADRPFVPEHHFFEVEPGQFVDAHLSRYLAPASWDVVLGRRTAIRKLMQASADCRVLIITMGLAEVWFDTVSGSYVNDTPRPELLQLYPSRFELHVLSVDEAYGFLERALLLWRQHGREDSRVVLTVSPVPLTATHRRMDVMVANSYSKSMLRVVAEMISTKYDWVDYYPSYESVMLSDRMLTWESDLVHVTGRTVAMNVGRMLDRYVARAGNAEDLRARIDEGGAVIAEEMAVRARANGNTEAEAFFAEFGAWSDNSPAFAVEHARFLMSADDCEGVLRVLTKVPSDWSPLAVAQIKAEAEMRLDRHVEAIATLSPFINDQLLSQAAWQLMVTAQAKSGDADGATVTTHRFLAVMSYVQEWAFLNLARALRDSDPVRAAYYYEVAIDHFLGDEHPWLQFEIAEYLTRQGRFAQARRMLAHLKPHNADIESRVTLLVTLLGPSDDAV